MFEKEAEEWVVNNLHSTEEDYNKAFIDGAEFGYNKGYHDAEEHYMNVIDSQHKLVEESKANEWYYVKDGDLPPKTTLVLIKACGCFILGWLDDNDVWHNDSDNGARIPKDNIYAWKEIVLPELKESE